MNNQRLQTSVSAVYRNVGNELVVIQVESGSFYYFNGETKALLDFFQTPSRVADLQAGAEGDDALYLERFCEDLVERGILAPARGDSAAPQSTSVRLPRPVFLREGDRKLGEIASEIAVLTSFA